MRPRVVAMIGVILILIATIFWFKNRQYVITLTDTQLQAKLDELFPFEKGYLFIIQVRLTDPDLRLEDGSDRIDYGMKVALTIADIEAMEGHARVSGSLRYEATLGAFFMDDSKIEELSVSEIPEQYQDRVRDAIRVAAQHFFDSYPVYRLKAGDLKQRAARLVLKDVKVVNRELHITLGL